jgi:nicotinamide-nucleotide amidase
MNSLIKKLIKRKIKIAFAESCTGGMLSSYITSISGSSKIFDLGLITYSNQSKIKILKVNKNIIKKYGAVSQQCCKAMAHKLSKISRAHINVSITGIAGPKGGTKYKPVGLVFIGVKIGKKIHISKNFFNLKNRISIQKAATIKALEIVNSLFV